MLHRLEEGLNIRTGERRNRRKKLLLRTYRCFGRRRLVVSKFV